MWRLGKFFRVGNCVLQFHLLFCFISFCRRQLVVLLLLLCICDILYWNSDKNVMWFGFTGTTFFFLLRFNQRTHTFNIRKMIRHTKMCTYNCRRDIVRSTFVCLFVCYTIFIIWNNLNVHLRVLLRPRKVKKNNITAMSATTTVAAAATTVTLILNDHHQNSIDNCDRLIYDQ